MCVRRLLYHYVHNADFMRSSIGTSISANPKTPCRTERARCRARALALRQLTQSTHICWRPRVISGALVAGRSLAHTFCQYKQTGKQNSSFNFSTISGSFQQKSDWRPPWPTDDPPSNGLIADVVIHIPAALTCTRFRVRVNCVAWR